MSEAPTGHVGSVLTFVHDLPTFSEGDKVRFLGCIEHYSVSKGTLDLRHEYLCSATHRTTARVNVDQILESLRSTDLSPGTWVNVIGYVTAIRKSRHERMTRHVRVQAVLLWPAQGLRLDVYEQGLEALILSRNKDEKRTIARQDTATDSTQL